MDDSDDYFQDAFELNDADLAMLAEEEQKHVQATLAQTQRPLEEEPPSKKLKIAHEDEQDDLLDVYVQPNGLYGIGSGSVFQNQLQQASEPPAARPTIPSLPQNRPKSTGVFANKTPSRTATTSYKGVQPSQLLRSVHYASEVVGTRGETNVAQRSFLSTADVTSGVNAILPTITEANKEYDELKQKAEAYEQLQREMESARQRIKDLEMAKFASEGEAAILRKKNEKATQQRIEVDRKLKEIEETRDREKQRLRREHKEAIERLRTESTFKQLELESSVRKATMSNRLNRISGHTSSQSPIPMPPAMRSWNSGIVNGLERSTSLLQTPSRAPVARRKGQERQEHANAPDLRFPGFQNSFAQSSPLQSPSRPIRIGTQNKSNSNSNNSKGKARSDDTSRPILFSPSKGPPRTFVFDDSGGDDTIQDYDADLAPEIGDGSPRRRSSRLLTKHGPEIPETPSVNGIDLPLDFDDNHILAVDQFRGIDWMEEFHHLIFSHVCSGSRTVSLNQLLSAGRDDEEYNQATSSLLESFGFKHSFSDLNGLMRLVAEKLITMGYILIGHRALPDAKALFALLTAVSLYIPSFGPVVFNVRGSVKGTEIAFLPMVEAAITVTQSKIQNDHVVDDAGTEFICLLLSLLETVFWVNSESDCENIIQAECLVDIYKMALGQKMPFSAQARAIKSLEILASHPSLLEPLTMTENHEKGGKDKLSVLLQRLSGFLMDVSWTSNFARYETLQRIFHVFTLLINAHPLARTYLVHSPTLILCIIHFLAIQTNMLWEDDERVMYSEENAKLVVLNVVKALQVLHNLVESPLDPTVVEGFDFRTKLYYAPHVAFNGLAHMFIVMIGRLSYADPPEWLSAELQAEIEKLTEPARDLMDRIIEGPEGDSVWEAYQETDVRETQTEQDDDDRQMDELMASIEL